MKVTYILAILIIYLEMAFKGVILESAGIMDKICTLLFSVPIFLTLNLLCNVFKEKISKTILILSSTILTLYFTIQAVFYDLFGIPFSFSSLGLAEGALGFTEVIKNVIIKNLLTIIILMLPTILTIIFLKKIKFERYNKKKVAVNFISIILAILLIISVIFTDRKETYSAYNLLFNIDAQEKNIEKFGLITSTAIDLQRTIYGFKEKDTSFVYEYIDNLEPTEKNEYTGYFKDKNLIFILAESFNTIAIEEKLTPTLYKLSNSGFVFNNFYSPLFLSTTGGEFQATTGLIPSQEILRLWKKDLPQIPYAIGNSFSEQGYTANAYHNWLYTYYDRPGTMKTLGFDSYLAIGNGLENLIDSDWIPSDVEMINATTDFYTSEDKFVTYYITVSGHAPYDFHGTNTTAMRYEELAQDLPYTYSANAYMATQIELDKAIETLINRLEKAGVLQDTVIALVGDHYPYTLTIDDINSISTYERDEIVEVNKSNFIIWNSEMKETIQIDKVGSQIDILPTLLNLFEIQYDSRYIIGQDILSDAPGIAIFSNRSWVSDYGTYFAAKKKFVPKENVSIKSNYVEEINESVANKFIMSNLFLKYSIYQELEK